MGHNRAGDIRKKRLKRQRKIASSFNKTPIKQQIYINIPGTGMYYSPRPGQSLDEFYKENPEARGGTIVID